MHTHKILTCLDTPGSRPLWQVFWLRGVLLSHLLFGAILLLYRQVDSVTLALLLAAFVGYTAWVLNAVWRNAGNVREPIYGEIARFLPWPGRSMPCWPRSSCCLPTCSRSATACRSEAQPGGVR